MCAGCIYCAVYRGYLDSHRTSTVVCEQADDYSFSRKVQGYFDPCYVPCSVLSPSLALAGLLGLWSGTEVLKDFAQSNSKTAAASGCIPLATSPLFSPTNTPVMLLGARLVFLPAAALGCAGWFLRATSLDITEPDCCGLQKSRAFY